MTLRTSPAELVGKAEASGRPGLVAKHPSWPRVPLSDVVTVVNGAAFKSSHFNLDRLGMPLIRIRDVGADTLSTWYDGPWDERHLVRKGDLIVGMDGEFRVAEWRLGEALLNQRVCRLDVDESKYDRRFLKLALQGYLDLIWSATSSTTVKHLSSRTIQEIPLPNPPLNEQRRIVNLVEEQLDHVFSGESSVTSAIKRVDGLEQAFIDASVTGPMVNLASVSHSAGYGTSVKCTAEGKGWPVARIPNIVSGQIDMSDLKRVAAAETDVSNYALNRNDLLIVRTNGSRKLIGRSAVVNTDMPVAFASYLIRYKIDAEATSARWVHLALRTSRVRREIESLAASSAGQYNLSLTKLDNLSIPAPDLEQQERVVKSFLDFQSELTPLRTLINTSRKHATLLRRAVLGAAFEGRLTSTRPPVAEFSDIHSSDDLAVISEASLT